MTKIKDTLSVIQSVQCVIVDANAKLRAKSENVIQAFTNN